MRVYALRVATLHLLMAFNACRHLHGASLTNAPPAAARSILARFLSNIIHTRMSCSIRPARV
jgi:hypothetical protein